MYCSESDLVHFTEDLEKAKTPDPKEALMILIAEDSAHLFNSLSMELNEKKIIFFGGVFPSLIHNENIISSGAIIQKVNLQYVPKIIHSVGSSTKEAVQKILPDKVRTNQGAFVYIDGLTEQKAGFLEALYDKYGSKVNFCGGGAGSLSLHHQPCIFTNEGIFEDAAVVAFSKHKFNIGVKHGWKSFSGPFVATKTEGSKIIELNWEPAFSLYKQYIKDHIREEISVDNFFDIAKGFPFGIMKEGHEEIVRDPIKIDENGEMLCVGEVPENTVLNILKGDPINLIAAAKEAASYSKQLSGTKPSFHFVIDCISRALFLESNFSKELVAIKKGLGIDHSITPVEGALTLGEIASFNKGYLEFFNKTTVVNTIQHAG